MSLKPSPLSTKTSALTRGIASHLAPSFQQLPLFGLSNGMKPGKARRDLHCWFYVFLAGKSFLFCDVLDCNQFQRKRTFNFRYYMRACNSDNRCFDPTPWSRLMGLFRNTRNCNGCCYLNSRGSPTDSDDGFDPSLRHSWPTRVDHRAHFG